MTDSVEKIFSFKNKITNSLENFVILDNNDPQFSKTHPINIHPIQHTNTLSDNNIRIARSAPVKRWTNKLFDSLTSLKNSIL